MGEKVAEEEHNKSKILALFEADISNKKIKTFYNGVAGVLEERQRQDRIIQEEKIFIIHPLSSFRFSISWVYQRLYFLWVCTYLRRLLSSSVVEVSVPVDALLTDFLFQAHLGHSAAVRDNDNDGDTPAQARIFQDIWRPYAGSRARDVVRGRYHSRPHIPGWCLPLLLYWIHRTEKKSTCGK